MGCGGTFLPWAGMQSTDPSSPAAASTDWPCTDISWKISDSMRSSRAPLAGSQLPHDVLTTWARSCCAIAP